MNGRHVVIIGAGIVGVCTALELLRDGWRVTLLDPAPPGGPQGASFGNGAWISPASIVPMSMPGLWRKIPGFLTDPLGPLSIRWSSLAVHSPWLIRFVMAGATVAKVEATAKALNALLADAPARHAALASEAGVGDLIQRTGLLYVWPDRAGFLAEALAWRLRRDNDVVWEERDRAALACQAPMLAARYTFGVFLPAGAHCTDPGRYVAALAAEAVRQGASVVSAAATGFHIKDDRLASVTVASGEIPCDRAVIAAGIASAALAGQVGDRIPLASERGYHVEIAEPEATPAIPVMPADGKMANTLVAGRLRAAGQVELATPDAPPDWRRAEVLLKHLKSAWPALPPDIVSERVTRWMGHRPSTPDGLPVIGPSRRSVDVIHAFGHGHVGLAAGPISGRLAADAVAGRETPAALLPARFRR
ncbi:MAG: NAD(P)/FAD-dependent oxidoreductase [Beijerinckiaceae bacterium]